MAKQKQTPLPADEEDQQPKISNKGRKKNTGKIVTNMKILNDEPPEPLSDFQTGAALHSRTGTFSEENNEPTAPAAPPSQTIQSKGIKINHVKLIKDLFLFIDFDKSNADGMVNNKMRCEAPVHDDLKAALNALNLHVATLGAQYNKDGKIDTESVKCVGFTLRTGTVYGVKLIGVRIISDNRQINVLPPFTKLSDGSSYEDVQDLESSIDTVLKEVKEYLDGKHKPDAQGAFSFPDLPTHPSEVFPAKEVLPDAAEENYAELDR